MTRLVKLPDGTEVVALGQGTWKIGEGQCAPAAEAASIRRGVELGLTLVDTAEMYGEGASERVIAKALDGLREKVFLVSKVYPHNASRAGVPAACARSLQRLGTDHLDLYLLHWRGGVPLAETVAAFERLKAEGRIRRWGVSNFDVDDMEELLAVPGGRACAVNQVLYNPEYRGIEFDLIPFMAEQGIPLMAYSPIGQGGRLLRNPALKAVAARHEATPAQVALAWVLRQPGMIAIPKAGTETHMRENAAAAGLALTPQDLAEIDAAYPPPKRKLSLAML